MMDKVYTQYRAGERKLLPAIAHDNQEDDARCPTTGMDFGVVSNYSGRCGAVRETLNKAAFRYPGLKPEYSRGLGCWPFNVAQSRL